MNVWLNVARGIDIVGVVRYDEAMTYSADTMDRIIQLRDEYVQLGCIELALAVDDDLEDHGMHGDDRRTCWTCQAFCSDEHAH